MKLFIFIFAIFFYAGCANSPQVVVEESDQIAVCGEIDGQKQTYPTVGDLHNDGAKFLFYGPCYE